MQNMLNLIKLASLSTHLDFTTNTPWKLQHTIRQPTGQMPYVVESTGLKLQANICGPAWNECDARYSIAAKFLGKVWHKIIVEESNSMMAMG